MVVSPSRCSLARHLGDVYYDGAQRSKVRIAAHTLKKAEFSAGITWRPQRNALIGRAREEACASRVYGQGPYGIRVRVSLLVHDGSIREVVNLQVTRLADIDATL